MTKKVLITGSTKGIGQGIAEKFHSENWDVCITGRNKDLIDESLKKLNLSRENSAIGLSCDLGSKIGQESLKNYVEKQWSQIDCIVFNVGSGKGTKGLNSKFDENLTVLKQNYIDVVNTFNMLSTLLKKDVYSSVIFIGSIAQSKNVGAPYAYSYAKKAINIFSKSKALTLSKNKIAINTVNPGHIMTIDGVWATKQNESTTLFDIFVSDNIPLGEIGSISNVSDLVYFYAASEDSKYLTGTNINLDGGTSIQ